MTIPRVRREPPPFRIAQVARVEQRSTRMTRVTLTGPDLEGFDAGLPAASVRILLGPDPTKVDVPIWSRNQFLLENGSRPTIRTLTPVDFGSDRIELRVDVVNHGNGPLSRWAGAAEPGDYVAVSGTGRGYDIDPTAQSFLLAGDESALPAISVLLEKLPHYASVRVLIEVQDLDARVPMPAHPDATVSWMQREQGARHGDALVSAVTAEQFDPDRRIWVAGEAAAVQRIRKHFFGERGLPRSHAVIRGYWKDDGSSAPRE